MREMGLFVGRSKNTSAGKPALQIHYAVKGFINPAIRKAYPNTSYVLRQGVGIDTSKLFIARTWARGANDLVRVGRSANYATKLCSVRDTGCCILITSDVFNLLAGEAKFGGTHKRAMWDKFVWPETGEVAYKSNLHWKQD